jgi:hypothetical protein
MVAPVETPRLEPTSRVLAVPAEAAVAQLEESVIASVAGAVDLQAREVQELRQILAAQVNQRTAVGLAAQAERLPIQAHQICRTALRHRDGAAAAVDPGLVVLQPIPPVLFRLKGVQAVAAVAQ